MKFVELNACPGGCVGGVLTVQNPFIAKARLRSVSRCLPMAANFADPEEEYIPEEFLFDEMPAYVPVSRLSPNFRESMRMMAEIQRIRETLPGIDCGACGAPTCRAHAEDAVRAGKRTVSCPFADSFGGNKT